MADTSARSVAISSSYPIRAGFRRRSSRHGGELPEAPRQRVRSKGAEKILDLPRSLGNSSKGCLVCLDFNHGAGEDDMTDYTCGIAKKPLDMEKFRGRTLMGYNSNSQIAGSDGKLSFDQLHVRAFVFSDSTTRMGIVVAEIWSCTLAIHRAVLELLKVGPLRHNLPPENVMITGTHTHSGPSGISDLKLYNAMTGGYSRDVVDHIAEVIHAALCEAYDAHKFVILEALSASPTAEAGKWFGQRSDEAYRKNPEVGDSTSLLSAHGLNGLRISTDSPVPRVLGALIWLPFHNTALGNSNRTLSGDIYGHSATKTEEAWVKGLTGRQRDDREIVVALLNGASGDQSPNMMVEGGVLKVRPKRESSEGRKIDEAALMKSLSDQVSKAVTRMIGREDAPCQSHEDFTRERLDKRQFGAGMANLELDNWQGNTWPYPGANLSSRSARTYPGAIGLSTFAGSSVDGVGPVGLKEGITRSNIEWTESLLKGVLQYAGGKKDTSLPSKLHLNAPILEVMGAGVKAIAELNLDTPKPTEPYWEGQGEKPIVFLTGNEGPRWVPIQIINIAGFWVLGFPGEITFQAAQRLTKAVKQKAESTGRAKVVHVAVTGCSNAYSQYVTTHQEYSAQHYEGSSTLFGPDTLEAYTAAFTDLVAAPGVV